MTARTNPARDVALLLDVESEAAKPEVTKAARTRIASVRGKFGMRYRHHCHQFEPYRHVIPAELAA